PPNILVKGKTLILADFGLSKFRDITKQSATRHQIGQGDYLAPECEELEGNFAKGIIGRSSDIWSFGVIMAEILTHLFKGASGVKAFREMRRYQLGNFFFSHFHHGPGAPNPAVAIWFSRLENEALAIPMFLPLIREMLPVKPTQRPKAIEVQARLQLIAVRLFASEINQQYNIACDRAGAVNAWIENWRFESWSHSRKAIRAEEASAMAERKGFEHDFDATFDILDRIHDQLHSIGLADRKGLERAFFPLRYLNNCLSELLPVSQQKEMQETFEHKILSIEDVQRLRDIGEALRTQKQGEHPARLAAIKRMTILAEQHLSLMHSDLMIGPNKVRPAQKCVKLRSGEVMTMEKGEGTEIVSVPVVVEWVLHDSHISEQVGHERLLSIDALATMLSLEDKPEEFRVLRCSAYFHDPHEPRSGLVFAIPTAPAVSEAPEVISLADLFRRDGTATGQRPALGDKFRLAVALTTSIAEFHKVGWLHKNISSANIVFFLRAGSSPETQITKPYIVGFNHSRLIIGITEGSYDIKYKDYQHPGYLRNELRFNFKFDYYSLGLGSARDWILAIA
ncbi:hypothetical protein MMC25_002685, partial [Agyrium rufum]|nr:hypothetical protein [Agyrium rufum]